MKNQQPDMSNNQLEALLKITAQRMGTTPEALKTAAENGDLSHMMGNIDQNQSAAMQKVLSDPDAAKKLLQMFQQGNGGKQ